MAKNQNQSGVGGWLGFLIVIMMFLAPMIGLGSLINDIHDAERQFPQLIANSKWSNYKQVSWLILAATVAISFLAGYQLWKIHDRESVRLAILALWLSGPFGNVLYLIAAVFVYGPQVVPTLLPGTVVGIIRSGLAAGIWTAYLMRSIRVKNTYKTDLNTLAEK